jgi:thiol reductant ABC exporter CydD subunit
LGRWWRDQDDIVKAVDLRLLRLGRATRLYLGAEVLLGAARAALLIAQAWLLATIISGAVASGKGLDQLGRPIVVLVCVVAARALVTWSSEIAANRCSAQVKSTLRGALAERSVHPGPDGNLIEKPGDLATLAVRGIDALDGFFSRYLPQLFLAVVVPVSILLTVLTVDWVSAVIMLVTLPLIPVFMALIGVATRARNDRQLRTLQRLSGHFLDVVSGLGTLKIFGRSKPQAAVIGELTDSYRRRLMSTLRLTFLSSLVLELLASVSVALIAVAIGLRLLNGHIDLRSSLFVLVLAPEAYLPLRQMAADFHASAEGRSAAEQVFSLLDRPVAPRGDSDIVPDPAGAGLIVESLGFTYPGRDRAAIDGLTVEVKPGEVLAVTGPSGCGKSTLLAILLGFVRQDAGDVLVGDVPLSTVDPAAWREKVAWVPQRPHLFAATIEDNILLGRPGATRDELQQAVAAAGLADLVARLPDGLATVIGERGAGLSAGERQRVALARAFVRDAPLLLLDEPTTNLDGETESGVLDAVRGLVKGRTVVLVAHRASLLTLAHRTVDLSMAQRPGMTSVPA